MPSLSPIADSKPRRKYSGLGWILLPGVVMAAVLAVQSAEELREHADQRVAVLDELGRLETVATAQSALVWKALSRTNVEDVHGVMRLRSEESAGRTRIWAHLERLKELELEGAEVNARLGFPADMERMERLEFIASSFMGGVQSSFGQLNLSVERIQSRLNNWDMNFGALKEVLTEVREVNTQVAAAASAAASSVTRKAALVTLLAVALFVIRLGALARRKERDLQRARQGTLERSEARFRELVQQSSDLILVLEEDGAVRYATPTVDALRPAGTPDEMDSAQSTSASADLDPTPDVRSALGLSPSELLAQPGQEVALFDSKGRRHIFDVRARDLSDHPDIAGIVVNARDITERKQLEDQLRYEALHDPLTDLLNRRAFQESFEELDQDERARAAVLFVDLDGFKLVNDSYGHAAGDSLLQATAGRLGTCIGPGDVLARQGGDEFLVLLRSEPQSMATRILEALRSPFQVEGHAVFISASIGIADDLNELTPSVAVQRADIAMYAAKQAGKAQQLVFAEEMLSGAPEKIQLEADFRMALERREFQVYYQPKVGFASGRIESLEALVRWISPSRGFVGPDLFIPFAEDSGLVCELGAQVFEQACRDALKWQDERIIVAVNLSPVQFQNPGLVQEIQAVLEETGVDPSLIELEITESAVLGDLDNTVRMMAELKALGLRLAIDDFGTGYSNLSHLKHFDVDVLKIDQAFVRGGNPSSVETLSDRTIVEAVIGMAKAFGMHVVAEGVESEQHCEELRDLGADLGQGFFFSRPVDSAGIDALLLDERGEDQQLAA